jgi:uncharacterized protein (DUF885 family)
MNEFQLSVLLTKFSLVDNRKITPETVTTWFDVLGDVDFDFAYEAGVQHFRDSTDYLTPAHIVAGAKRLQQQNVAAVREGRARGVVPSDWPETQKLSPALADALSADRAARRGVWIGRSWFESWDAYNDLEQRRGLERQHGFGAIDNPAEPAAPEYLR